MTILPPFKILLLGTGPFAIPAFQAIRDAGYLLPALITRPDQPTRGKSSVPHNPARAWAEQVGLPVLAPPSINSPEAQAILQDFQADLFMVCDYGQILSRQTLALARLGGINLHGSLLPRYRGAAPIQWAIYHGETTTGVTVIHMTPQLDAGPCLVQRSTAIGPEETNVELEPRLAALGAEAVLSAIQMLQTDPGNALKQDCALASKAPRLSKADGILNWSRTAEQLCNQVRAWQPWPKSFTTIPRPGAEPLRVIIERVTVLPESELTPLQLQQRPGTVLVAAGEQLLIRCGEGSLLILELQPAGKKVLSAGDFIRGYKPSVGETWGELPTASDAAGKL